MDGPERRVFLRNSGLAITAAALGDGLTPVPAPAQIANDVRPAQVAVIPKGLTHHLARFILSTRFEDIPAAVRHEAKRTLLNWVGCTVGACRQDTVTKVITALAPFAGQPQA